MTSELPDFYALEDTLWRLDADFSATEVHGIHCAVLSINHAYDQQMLREQVVAGDIHDAHYQELMRALSGMYMATKAQLNSGDLQFVLLMPDDHDALAERLLALQKWCQGFAYGLALSGLKTMADLPDDSREWVQDMIKIGASGEFDLEDEEASEAALLDLTEFLRVGVLMMNEEVQPMRSGSDIINHTLDKEGV